MKKRIDLHLSTAPLRLASMTLFLFILGLGSCKPINGSSDELGDGTVSVSMSKTPVYVINSSDYSCPALYETDPAIQDITGPRITLPTVSITWKSPTQYLKIQNAFIKIKFAKSTAGPFQIKIHSVATTITPVYFINPYNTPCRQSDTPSHTLEEIDNFDGRDVSSIPGSERCTAPGQTGNTYRQICPFKVGGLPAYSAWKNEASVVTASLYLQGNSTPMTITDPTNVVEYPWFSKIDFSIENPCANFPDACL